MRSSIASSTRARSRSVFVSVVMRQTLLLRPMSRARLLLAGVVGYALGTIPSADLASRFASRGGDARVDLRSAGSGNPGATNAANVLGTSWGVAVLGADIAKGVTAGFAGRALAGD